MPTFIREILLKTHAILSQDGVWVQFDKKPHAANCQCLMTAVNKAIENSVDDDMVKDARDIIVAKLIAQIPADQLPTGSGFDHTLRMTPRVLIDWNDAKGRTREDVLALLVCAFDKENVSSTWNEQTNVKPQYDPGLLAVIAEAIEKGSKGLGNGSPFGLFDYSRYGATATPHHVRDFRPGSPTRNHTVFRTSDGIEARVEYNRLTREHTAGVVMDAVTAWMNKRIAA